MSQQSFLDFLLAAKASPLMLARYDGRNLAQLLLHAKYDGYDFSANDVADVAEEEATEEFFATVWPLTQGHRLRKRRYRVPGATGVWEVDEFLDRELILAEIELEAEDQPVEIPPEIAAVMDREVTDEPAFSNYKLSR